MLSFLLICLVSLDCPLILKIQASSSQMSAVSRGEPQKGDDAVSDGVADRRLSSSGSHFP